MNRLVIVGNGFDLAHGLPTGYCDFIDSYWDVVLEDIKFQNESKISYEDNLISFQMNFGHNYPITAVENFRLIKTYDELTGFANTFNSVYTNADLRRSFTFKNRFFHTINKKKSIQNWVDIENEYYRLLKDCLKEGDNSKVKKLNQEFEQVKILLITYLHENINEEFDFKTTEDLLPIVQLFEKTGNESGTQNLFLNFNYTKTIDAYITAFSKTIDDAWRGKSQQIQIHGKLNDPDNTVNFGFGDEMDDDYKAIEKKDDNEYLKNIKSFQYFQNSNYKNMLGFVDRSKFQVFIMGHSCGLSDRILLNKIFEHRNCTSIKVFYYKNGDWDNYTEIVQNISRHFNKKEMMREKIVNKSLCQPLPQNIRFAKKENGSQS
ncbi:AbiH family protein [Flavobacterium sp. DG1-102-2]|uniref:AbiH family protein n=1 Tax=Flavobacterium sp. DG1-102-2 TaxID=3081663 RepID=UPI0029495ECD|nr:AbiH family protein [Flavobacterium sp. DG1-102-2]MDV6169645.1 AbiH family protein [Flavobacterium sp. DG1-102-2]